MSGGSQLIDRIEIDLKDHATSNVITIYIDVFDNSLSKKWLSALNNLVENNFHLEKNYCFVGFVEHQRNAEYICNQINHSIQQINQAKIGYQIDDYFTVENTITTGPVGEDLPGCLIVHDKMNHLHRYFEDLQGVSGHMTNFYNRADAVTRWHIRQLNLLCHEYESLVLSMRKAIHAPEWRRPSQLMCWLNAPRFLLEEDDYELFGIETLARPLGGVFVGVNKAVGKHHWEVYRDENRDIDELITTTMRGQTEAAGDFDIEWGNNPGNYPWMRQEMAKFRQWLIDNGFDPDDKKLTIGHPQVGQVDLDRSFGTTDYQKIWNLLSTHLDVYRIKTAGSEILYNYNWNDSNYAEQQIAILSKGN
jgi:hypothetical protein